MRREADIDYRREHDLTVEEIKASSIFEHLTDAEADEVITTLKTLAEIAFDCYKKVVKNDGKSDNFL